MNAEAIAVGSVYTNGNGAERLVLSMTGYREDIIGRINCTVTYRSCPANVGIERLCTLVAFAGWAKSKAKKV